MSKIVSELKAEHILPGMVAKKKADAIRELASMLEGSLEIPDFRRFLSVLFQKEARFQSAVDKGVALPHYRDESVQGPAVVLGISSGGIDWGNGEVVHILVIIGWPDRNDEAYLMLVADIARWLHRDVVRAALQEAESVEEVIEILDEDWDG
jgi:mannitol/fructose-specific phosphotransferase system IIA component (Ntr-type)